MGERGPKSTPAALQLVRGDPRNQGKAKLAARITRSDSWASDQAALPGFEKPQEGGWGRS